MTPDHLTPPTCPFCMGAVHLASAPCEVRRGGLVLPIALWTWECNGACKDPTLGTPFRFADPPLLTWNDRHAAAEWLRVYREPIPPSARHRESVQLSPPTLRLLDAERGDRSREAFLQELIQEHRKAS